VTAEWLRASLRAVDEKRSVPGAPVLPRTTRKRVRAGKVRSYRIPIVPNARRFAAGHRLRLVLASDDNAKGPPAITHFKHAPVGEAARTPCTRPRGLGGAGGGAARGGAGRAAGATG
jgi:hypothetical protein